MSIFNPICPARGIYGHIERLEARREQIGRMAQAVAAGAWPGRDAMLERLEALDQALILEGERARDELAEAGAISAEGATCQLIAALRDGQSGDPEMQRRADRLIARSGRFAGKSAASACLDRQPA
jgi:hypothetical protein